MFDQRGVDAQGRVAGRVRVHRDPAQGHGAHRARRHRSGSPRGGLGLGADHAHRPRRPRQPRPPRAPRGGVPRAALPRRPARATSCAGASRRTRGRGPLDSSLLAQGRFAAHRRPRRWLAAPPLGAAPRAPARAGRLADDRGAALRVQPPRRASWALMPSLLARPGRASCVAAGGVWSRPSLLLVAARERRSRNLSEQLPEALDMMARSLRAGHALTSAFQLVADGDARAHQRRVRPRLRGAAAGDAARAGGPRDGARAPRRTATSRSSRSPRVIQKETGGNLAEILDGIAATVRDRYRFFGKLRALTAEARVSAWLVALMPLGDRRLHRRRPSPTTWCSSSTTPLGQTILAVGRRLPGSWAPSGSSGSPGSTTREAAMHLDWMALVVGTGSWPPSRPRSPRSTRSSAASAARLASSSGGSRRRHDLPELVEHRSRAAQMVAQGLAPIARLATPRRGRALPAARSAGAGRLPQPPGRARSSSPSRCSCRSASWADSSGSARRRPRRSTPCSAWAVGVAVAGVPPAQPLAPAAGPVPAGGRSTGAFPTRST